MADERLRGQLIDDFDGEEAVDREVLQLKAET